MKTFLESSNRPAKFCAKTGLVTVGDNAVATDEMVTACAWHCGGVMLTEKIKQAGYKNISHGCCEDCAEKMNEEIEPVNADD